MLFGSNVNLGKVSELQNFGIQSLAAAPVTTGVTVALTYYDTVKKSVGVWDVGTTTWHYYDAGQVPISAFLAATANLNLGGFKITNQGLGVAVTDSASVQNILNTSISSLTAPTGALAMGGFKITGVANGSAAQDVATMANLTAVQDGLIAGQAWKGQIRTVFTTNTALAAGATTNDGVTLNNGDRVLLTAQTTPSQNGPYIWSTGGNFTRVGDAAQNYELQEGSTWEITEGTLGNPSGTAPQRWYVSTTGAITVGTTSVSIILIGAGGGTYTAGANINITSNVISVTAGTFTKKYATQIGNGALTSITITHNLALTAVGGIYPCSMTLLDGTTGTEAMCDKQSNTANTCVFSFAIAPATNAYVAVIVG